MIRALDELTERFSELFEDARQMKVWDRLTTRICDRYRNGNAKEKKSWDKILTTVGKMDEEQLKEVEGFIDLRKTYGAEADALYTRIDKSAVKAEEYIRNNPPSPGAIVLLVSKAQLAMKLEQAKKGGKVKDVLLGQSVKRKKIQEIWASGKYDSRDVCAEQECAALDMSFSTARKALRGTPKPSRHQ